VPVALGAQPAGAPVGLGVNSAGSIVIADDAGFVTEYATDGTPGTSVQVAADAIRAFAVDDFIARLLLVVDHGGGAFEVAAQANRRLSGGVQPILDNRCIACHAPGFTEVGLVLTRGKTIAQTVSVTACEAQVVPDASCGFVPTFQNFNFDPATATSLGVAQPGAECQNCPFPQPLARVQPGDPDASYLVRKIQADQPGVDLAQPNQCALDVCGERMPQASQVKVALRQSEIDAIRAWIANGAADD
jgi:hypothetical protein